VSKPTKKCLGLPLFAAGAKVTAEMIVSALKELLQKTGKKAPAFMSSPTAKRLMAWR
jgi:hypothetical protein